MAVAAVRRSRQVVLLALAAGLLGIAAVWVLKARREKLVVSSGRVVLPADGAEHQGVEARLSRGGDLGADELRLSAGDLATRVVATSPQRLVVEVRSPVNAGAAMLKLGYRGTKSQVAVQFVADDGDSVGDGTPDFLRLHGAGDRAAFRAWFAALADTAATLSARNLPHEIDDCAALLRWCYRGALHGHDAAWLQTMPMDAMPPLGSVAQYVYPHTPVGAGLFRVRPGPYTAQDASNGSFAQFADAKTLWQHNTFLVSRDLRAARTGDLLFYRQLEQNSPYHSMVLTGASHEWAVYHTGPIGNAPGEVRRVLLTDLMHHPDTRWRPVSQNSNFLGVYRWNILREDPR